MSGACGKRQFQTCKLIANSIIHQKHRAQKLKLLNDIPLKKKEEKKKRNRLQDCDVSGLSVHNTNKKDMKCLDTLFVHKLGMSSGKV